MDELMSDPQSPLEAAPDSLDTQDVGRALFAAAYSQEAAPDAQFELRAAEQAPEPEPVVPPAGWYRNLPQDQPQDQEDAPRAHNKGNRTVRQPPRVFQTQPVSLGNLPAPGAPSVGNPLGISMPPGVAAQRDVWYRISQTGKLKMSWAEVEAWLPWMSNVWTHKETKPGAESGPAGLMVSRYRCKMHAKKLPKTKGSLEGRGKSSRKPICCPATLKIERFADDSCVVSGNHDHLAHGLPYLDSIAIPKAIRDQCRVLMNAGIGHVQVCEAIFGLGKKDREEIVKRLRDAGGELEKTLVTTALRNSAIADGVHLTDHRKAGPRAEEAEQIADMISFLEEKSGVSDHNWKCKRLSVKEKNDPESPVVAFARNSSIDLLKKRGKIVVMDATHCTVKENWYLYTIMLRDKRGVWLPGAFFYSKRKGANSVTAGLRQIIEWCGGIRGWRLQYIVTDDDPAEYLAARTAFEYNPDDPNPRVQHLYCRTHSLRNLQDNLKGLGLKKVFDHMHAALYRRSTEETCLQSIQAALDEPSCTESARIYIQNQWLPDTRSWANWYRHTKPLLSQIDTTNYVESWHKQLKLQELKGKMKGFSLQGGVERVMEVDDEYRQRAINAERREDSRVMPIVQHLPEWGFEMLPESFQQDVWHQLQIGKVAADSGEELVHRVVVIDVADPSLAQMPQCNCLWFRRWQLPCCHIWHHHYLHESLQPANFFQLLSAWKENGWELYDELEEPFASGLDTIIGGARRLRTEYRSMHDIVTEAQWTVTRWVESFPPAETEAAQEAANELTAELRDVLGWWEAARLDQRLAVLTERVTAWRRR